MSRILFAHHQIESIFHVGGTFGKVVRKEVNDMDVGTSSAIPKAIPDLTVLTIVSPIDEKHERASPCRITSHRGRRCRVGKAQNLDVMLEERRIGGPDMLQDNPISRSPETLCRLTALYLV